MQLIRVRPFMSLNRLIRTLAAECRGKSVLLVPRAARWFRDPVNLELLALYTRAYGYRALIVSADRTLLRRAAEAGFEVHRELPGELAGLAEEELSAAGGDNPPPRLLRHLPPWLPFAAMFMIFLGALTTLWPRPTVVVTAARQRLAMTVRADVSPSYRENQINKALLPARLLAKTGMAVAETPATGVKMEGDTPARGHIVFLNEGNRRITVPQGTILQGANGLRYRTGAVVIVPEAKRNFLLGIQVGRTSGQAGTAITAETPGTAGNLGAGKITVIIGPLAHPLKAINTETLSGGTDRRVVIVTAADAQSAFDEALRQMELEAEDSLRALTGAEQIILPETISLRRGRAATVPGIGETGSVARVSLPYKSECLTISRAILAKFLAEQADEGMPGHFILAREPITVQEIHCLSFTSRTARLVINASYAVQGRLERGRILAAIRGRTDAEARRALCGLPEIGTVRMNIRPGDRFPRFSRLIRLILASTGKE